LPKLLFEIGCEELPAGSVYEAEAQLPGLSERHLGAAPDQVLVGPRRLAILVSVEEPAGEQWIKGPPVSLREKAAAGFAKRHGVSVEDLEERDGFLGVVSEGQSLGQALPGQLDAILRGLRFGKTMRWDDSGLRFPRPVRWTCARLDAEPVEGHGTETWGHRFTHGRVEVPSADAYVETLRGAGVEPETAERERLIREGLDALGDWSDPLGKLREVVHLVEQPIVSEGTFDERFLSLPARVIETAMQSHQRYFPLGGNRFAFVANGGDQEVVRRGNENVLEGRLDDASFTFERDLKAGIDELAGRLGSIVYFAEAGTFADKTDRLVSLVDRLRGGEASLEAARLAKADQASELVREFPDLEGTIGAEYARVAGYPDAVSAAIAEQYLPDAAGGPLPQSEAGRVLAAADKIDTLTVSFSLGHKPTGSRDPFGLRRAAIGLGRLATEGGLTIPRELLPGEVGEFVEERFEGLLRDVPVEYVRPGAGRAARRAPGADPHRLHPREPPRGEREGRREARSGAPHRAGRARGRRGARPGRARDRRRPGDRRLRGRGRGRREARPGAAPLLRGRARHGRGREGAREPPPPPAGRPRHASRARRSGPDPALTALNGRTTGFSGGS
jgi:glycyl-tRNA synthetase beta chain